MIPATCGLFARLSKREPFPPLGPTRAQHSYLPERQCQVLNQLGSRCEFTVPPWRLLSREENDFPIVLSPRFARREWIDGPSYPCPLLGRSPRGMLCGYDGTIEGSCRALGGMREEKRWIAQPLSTSHVRCVEACAADSVVETSSSRGL